jgi:hypothetical protein
MRVLVALEKRHPNIYLSNLFLSNMLPVNKLCNSLYSPKATIGGSHVLSMHKFGTFRCHVSGD